MAHTLSRIALAALTTVTVAATATACASNEKADSTSGGESTAALSGELIGAGASSQGSAQDAWIAGFQSANPGVTVNYDPSGSGNGRDTFINGASSFAGSDRAFKLKELTDSAFAACEKDAGIVELPAYISPIVVVFNLDSIKELNLDGPTLAKIFTGAITTWNDPAIAEQNPGVTLPDTRITPVHRSDKSGTTQNFTDYLAAQAKDTWTAGAVDAWPTELGGEAAAQTSGMVNAVKNGVGTIGYVDASRAEGLGAAKIKVGDTYVAHSAQAAAKVVETSPIDSARGEHDLAVELDRTTTDPDTYPIVLVSYLMGCVKYKDAKAGELAKAYFNYIISPAGQKAAADAAGSAPLSDGLTTKAQAIVDAIS